MDDDCNGIADENAGNIILRILMERVRLGYNRFLHRACRIVCAQQFDCDDADASQNPQGIEICGEDDNCNGISDDNANDASIWYADTDGDTMVIPFLGVSCIPLLY